MQALKPSGWRVPEDTQFSIHYLYLTQPGVEKSWINIQNFFLHVFLWITLYNLPNCGYIYEIYFCKLQHPIPHHTTPLQIIKFLLFCRKISVANYAIFCVKFLAENVAGVKKITNMRYMVFFFTGPPPKSSVYRQVDLG